jgi:hypothetical protein
MNIAFDTNVLLNEDEWCIRIVEKLFETDRPLFKLAMDDTRQLDEEYLRYEHLATEGTVLQKILQCIALDADEYVARLNRKLYKSEKKRLKRLPCKSCVRPTESTLIGMARRNKNTWVYLCGKHPSPIRRGYAHCRNKIRDEYLNNRKLQSTLNLLLDDFPLPDNCDDLAFILNRLSFSGDPTELERFECKRQLSEFLLEGQSSGDNDRFPKTVCAMLNKRGGYIFIGVEDGTFEITGFERSDKWKSVDDALQVLQAKIGVIEPNATEWVTPTPVKGIKDNKIVIAVYVKKSIHEHYYGDYMYRRNGNSNSIAKKRPK